MSDEMSAIVQRINELARKNKQEGLTVTEIEERTILREKYLTLFRTSMKIQLDSIKFTDDQK